MVYEDGIVYAIFSPADFVGHPIVFKIQNDGTVLGVTEFTDQSGTDVSVGYSLVLDSANDFLVAMYMNLPTGYYSNSIAAMDTTTMTAHWVYAEDLGTIYWMMHSAYSSTQRRLLTCSEEQDKYDLMI
jgi:hypothetical protein